MPRTNPKRNASKKDAIAATPAKSRKLTVTKAVASKPQATKATTNGTGTNGVCGRHARFDSKFYDLPCLDLAKKLLGCKLVRKLDDGTVVSGLIVETESYLGNEDPSAHSYSGQTDRNKAMFMDPGTSYVYNIYGTYCCMNISSKGEGHAVLLRALDPVEGLDQMRIHRQAAKKQPTAKPLQDKELCSGPSKFCQALAIDKASINELDMPTSDRIWLEKGIDIASEDIITSTRIGIEGAGEDRRVNIVFDYRVPRTNC